MIGRRSHDDAQAFEDAWAGRTPRDEHIAELVRCVESLCEAAVAEPSTQFRDSLRTQLMDEARTVLVPISDTPPDKAAPPRVAHPLRRRVAAVTAALVASAGVMGLVASSASAVPGEMLYPVKRTVESVELALHRDDASRGSLQLTQASERLAETRELADKGATDELIADSLDDFTAQAEFGATSLFSDFSDKGKDTSVEEVNDFAASSSAELARLSSRLPSGADDSFDAATSTISDLATQASSLCVSCSPADVQQLVNAVSGLAKTLRTNDQAAALAKKVADKAAADKAAADKDGSKSTSSSSDSTNPTTPSTKTPDLVLPVTPPTKTPSLQDLTDPLLGGLLGDEDQEGLVPGLLGGGLGGGGG